MNLFRPVRFLKPDRSYRLLYFIKTHFLTSVKTCPACPFGEPDEGSPALILNRYNPDTTLEVSQWTV